MKGQAMAAQISYFRLTGIGVEFLESCARDEVKALQNLQEALKKEREDTEEYKRGVRATRRKFRLKVARSVVF